MLTPPLLIVGLFGPYFGMLEYVFEQVNVLFFATTCYSSFARTTLIFMANILVSFALNEGIRSGTNLFIYVLLLGLFSLSTQVFNV